MLLEFDAPYIKLERQQMVSMKCTRRRDGAGQGETLDVIVDDARGAKQNLLSADKSIISKKTGLTLPADLPLDSWRHLGEHISQISNASAWWLGDWLVFGHDKYPDRYKRAMVDTSLDYGTLRNYAWIARRFEPARRREALSFQHHVEVAALPEKEQEHWLDFAEKFSWSRNELRKQLRASYADDQPALDENPEINLRLRVAKDQIERWEKAAQRVGTDLVDWIAATLEKATRSGSSGSGPRA
ncbi:MULTISPECIES: LmbU family transcriptional regulator [unclassified Streptomyces]|uniref:LmbU family transcriptional regulator n=1 Tax=unclassified Streptomyces TaxID=2593676 RepID=UPI0036E9394E